MMLTRRAMLASATVLSLAVLSPAWLQPARAQSPSAATQFIQSFGSRLVAVVNGGGAMAEKQEQLRPLIDNAVDVDAIARFCLGRFVNMATPQQIADYTKLFHAVLVDNITGKIGEFRGVTFRMTDTAARDGEDIVGTIVQRPNQAPADVRWVVSGASGSPKIIDVIAEGTSLRLTQRADYASFLSHHANNVATLISAMRQQVSAS